MFEPNKIKTLLEKINWLTNSFEENNYNNISALEKSLLKEKVLIFFDEIENIPTFKVQETPASVEKNFERPVLVEVKIVEEQVVVVPPAQEEKEVVAVVDKIEEPVVAEPEYIEPVVSVPVVEVPKVEEVITTPPVEIIPEPIIEAAPVEKIVEPVQEVITPPVVEAPKVEAVSELSKEEKFQKMEAFHKQVATIRRDMREIIDLNKSFIFKAELFNQNNDLYNQFINEMNNTLSEDNAFILLNNWTMKMNWRKDENKAYELLAKAVERRFQPLIS